MSDEILVEIADPVATIRLNRPDKLNALTYPMLAELRRAIDAAAASPAVVGIVITGNGRGFCSGLDAAVLAQTTRGETPGGRDAAGDEIPGLFFPPKVGPSREASPFGSSNRGERRYDLPGGHPLSSVASPCICRHGPSGPERRFARIP